MILWRRRRGYRRRPCSIPRPAKSSAPLGHLYGLIALAVFLAMEGPLVLVGALVESYRAVPAGGLGLNEGAVSQVFAQVGGALALSLRAAAPVAIALAVAGIVLGWIGRLAPAVPFLAPLSSRSLDAWNRSDLPQPRDPGCDALAGMDKLALGAVSSELDHA